MLAHKFLFFIDHWGFRGLARISFRIDRLVFEANSHAVSMPELEADLAADYWEKWLSNLGRLRALSLRWVAGDEALSNDLLSEASLHALEKYRVQAKNIKNFEAWISTVTFRLFLQHRRKQYRHLEILAEYQNHLALQSSVHGVVDPLAVCEAEELAKCYASLCRRLPSGLADVVNLIRKGYSPAEISLILNISERNVRKRLELARKKLMSLMICEFGGRATT